MRTFIALLLLCPLLAQAAIRSETLEYQVDGQSFLGYLVYDDRYTDSRPGVLVVHEWWGQNAYARQRANMLAAQGYVALALDMYGDGQVTSHPKEAQAFVQASMARANAIPERFEAARDALARHPRVDGTRLAAIGYCFGGGVVLNMARAGTDLRGVVSYHGSLGAGAPITEERPVPAVLVFNGEADPMVPAEQVQAFRQEMQGAEVNYRYVGYPGVLHSFTNPGATAVGKEHGLPLAYDADADADSWNQTLQFLSGLFWR